MSSKIVVTGLGIISAIGNNVEESFDALVNEKSGIKPISILDTIHKNEFVLGEVKKSHSELITLADVDPGKPWTRTALLGMIAARQAFLDAGLDKSGKYKTGLVSATTVGGMDRSELHYNSFLNDEAYNAFIDTHHAGDSTEKIAEYLNIKDYLTTISTACSSSLNSIMFGARLIRNGIVDKVIAGGTDGLSKFTLNGFNTLMILDREHCRPFDATRAGLNLGEGAAYITLQSEASAIKEDKKIYAVLSGYANANDAFHQTASSENGEGPFLAMHNALKKANLSPENIDYINVHGTGTDNNDLTEGKAMIRLFGNNPPPFSSTKAYTGHTLGAAGSVESIISILSLQNNMMFPNINFKNKIPEIDIEPISKVEKKKLYHVLTNSFGFGGNDSSLIFSKNRN
jgi:3-oxoacyl-[acyl-carrier-protein] synthase-1